MKVYNGTIITCDKDNTVYQYLVEDQGRIVFVGNELPEKYSGANQVKLAARSLIPSFGDSHLHLAAFATFEAGLNIRNSESIEAIKDAISAHAAKTNDKVIMGFGLSANSVREKRLLTKEDIDHVCPDRPVFIVKYDGHAAVVNTKMIENLPKKIKQLRGFNTETGIMHQEAFFAITDYVTFSVSLYKTLKNLFHAVDLLAKQGIGMIHSSAGVGFMFDLDIDLERFLARGLQNPFQIRVFFQTMRIEKVIKRKLSRIGGCFETALDGCFGTEDAAMNIPYLNDYTNSGILFYTDQQVIDFAKRANRAGLQIALHAIGDAAFDQAVKAFEACLDDHSRDDHRHTIIHACLPTEKSLEKCADLGIAIAAQPSFLMWKQEPYEYLFSILGSRIDQFYPFKQMIDMGIMISGGSDAPCTYPDPIFGIYAACNHYVPGFSVSIEEALKMFTYNVAWATFDEKERGSLETGKKADMVILNKNPLQMEKKDILDLSAEELYLNGKKYVENQSTCRFLLKGILGDRIF